MDNGKLRDVERGELAAEQLIMEMKLELKGLQDVNRKLEGRIRRLEQSVLRKALLAFAEPVRAQGERLARTNISPRIKVVTTTKMRGSSGTVKVGPSTEVFDTDANGRSVTMANVAYWWEFGFKLLGPPYRSQKGGPVIQHFGARPSMTPAYESQKGPGLAAFEQVIRENLEQEVG
jgi:hypothetical protein